MGCVSSKPDINDQHPNIFQVTNVNDQGDLISPGQLEVTETELVLHQRGKSPTIWPLKSLRKYGFDAGIFSFECGRRCPTGHGFYAFQCRKAEQLFNIVQHHIVRHSNNDETTTTNPITTTNAVNATAATAVVGGGGVINSNEFSVLPLTTTVHPCTIPRRIPSQPEGYLNPVTAPMIRQHPTLSRPGSISSNGPISPTPASSPPPDLENNNNNNNKRTSLSDRQYTNLSEPVQQTSYVNFGCLNSPNAIAPTTTTANDNYVNVNNDSPCHLYMNIDTKDDSLLVPMIDDTKHCYANINAKDLEHLKPLLNAELLQQQQQSVPQTPTSPYITIAQEVNYAELDLSDKNDTTSASSTTTLTTNTTTTVPESPNKDKKSYATIDFQRTNALSQSINPSIDVEEGSRKTRHNSTISDVTRHSNSLSD